MQLYTAELARNKLSSQTEDIVIGDSRYRADITGETGWVNERGPAGEKKYRIDHLMGGKNVYYFLTSRDRGRLQTLPVAYDVHKKEWFDMAASGVRHFPGQTDGPINWKDWPYTFNTACYGCHVSQVSTNYDLKTDSYHTVWKESGINCETCHGPADEHIRVCEAAPKGTVPKELKIVRGGRDFSKEQNNVTCSGCHAKSSLLTKTFNPGERFFDHFDLVTLESPDYYPDGRDLGENYTYTSWIMSSCVKSGKLDCLHCHTSSGRYKFKVDDKANQACMPCHQDKVSSPTEHTRHKADSPGNKCISCHMPTTEFARMRRSDHSMRPPAPAATLAFKSPNACNLCHNDKTAEWADDWVRKWRSRDYQAPILQRAGLVDAARKRDWSRLPDMLAYLESESSDKVYATSLLRLLRTCDDEKKWPQILRALNDPSPLVRSAAAESLAANLSKEAAQALLRSTADDYRLVRIRAATSLAGFPGILLKDRDLSTVRRATEELLTSLLARPDQWSSHYNLGNYYLKRGKLALALTAFDTASKLDPNGIHPLVNMSIVHARMGNLGPAEVALNRVLSLDAKNPAAHFNMGLLKAEQGDLPVAEKHLRAALASDPHMGEAAYNLSVILAIDRLDEAIIWCSKAVQLRPREAKYIYTLAFYHQRKGESIEAVKLLRELVNRKKDSVDAWVLLGEIYEKRGQMKEAEDAYSQLLTNPALSMQERRFVELKLKKLSSQ